MVNEEWKVVFTKAAQKDAKKLLSAGLKPETEKLIAILRQDPLRSPPPFEKLVGDFTGACSRRINIQHRLVYQVVEPLRTVKILRMWSHYD